MRHVFAAAAAMFTLADASQAATLYTNDFSTDANGFSGFTGIETAPSNEKFLGQFGPAYSSTLTIDTTGVTTPITLAFDLYAIQTVDGEGTAGGNSVANPDSFVIASNGVTLFNYSFANYTGDTQSYPIAGSPAQKNATAVNTLGYGNYGDATYSFSGISITPTGNSTTITFTSNTNQSIGDEGYGIDNVTVTGTRTTVAGAVPEPASWAMFIGGFGLVGGAARRRRQVVRFA